MPKAFNERERDYIRNTLLEKGRELFGAYGLKKTSVADLTRAAGIAQGTFYKFYESKEELYFEILEREEATREGFLGNILAAEGSARDKLERLIRESFALIDHNAFIRNAVERNDYETLLRRLPSEKLQHHLENDTRAVLQFINAWQAQGELIDKEPEVVTGLFRSLFFLSVHRQEIGSDIYPKVIALLGEVIARGLTKHD